MEKNKNMFLSSAKELKSVPALAMCAMFAALALILNSVASINLGPYIKIGFSGITNKIVDYLIGPIIVGLFAGNLDLFPSDADSEKSSDRQAGSGSCCQYSSEHTVA